MAVPSNRTAALTVVIYPLVAVLDDMVHRLGELTREGVLQQSAWRQYKGDATPRPSSNGDMRLLLVSAEQARSQHFMEYLVSEQSNIVRVVFDEAPQFLESAYRVGLSSLPLCIRAKTIAPFVLLTATAPPDCIEGLKQGFASDLEVIRGPTTRPNITLRVETCNSGLEGACKRIVSLLERRRMEEKEEKEEKEESGLSIVFVLTKALCSSLAKMLKQALPDRADCIEEYRADLPEAEKRATLGR
jgi:superfamily II DNA helicase RecQ